MTVCKKKSSPIRAADGGNPTAPYAVCSVGDMKISFFSRTDLCSFSKDFGDTVGFRGCCAFLCVRSGSIMLEGEDGVSAVLTEDSVAVIPPDHPYKISKIGEETEHTAFFLSFDRLKTVAHGQFSEYAYYSALFSSVDQIRVLEGEMLLALLENMGTFLRGWNARIDHIVQSYMTVFFIEVAGALSAETDRQPSGNAVRDDRYLHKTHRRWVIENYIANSYTSDNPTEELMLKLFLSKRQTDRVVYQLMGESLASLITKQRIFVTEKLLETTDLTLQEISERVGYHSYSGFYSAVRKYRDTTPEKLQRKIRGERK